MTRVAVLVLVAVASLLLWSPARAQSRDEEIEEIEEYIGRLIADLEGENEDYRLKAPLELEYVGTSLKAKGIVLWWVVPRPSSPTRRRSRSSEADTISWSKCAPTSRASCSP